MEWSFTWPQMINLLGWAFTAGLTIAAFRAANKEHAKGIEDNKGDLQTGLEAEAKVREDQIDELKALVTDSVSILRGEQQRSHLESVDDLEEIRRDWREHRETDDKLNRERLAMLDRNLDLRITAIAEEARAAADAILRVTTMLNGVNGNNGRMGTLADLVAVVQKDLLPRLMATEGRVQENMRNIADLRAETRELRDRRNKTDTLQGR